MTLQLLFVFVISGAVVTLATLVAEKIKNPMLAGLIIMFPSLTLLSVYFIAKAADVFIHYLRHLFIFYFYCLWIKHYFCSFSYDYSLFWCCFCYDKF